MDLLLTRTSRQEEFTTGVLFIGKEFFCHTLEPHAIDWRYQKKVPGKTAIPDGDYKVTKYYSPHFKRMMPLLEKVPHFRGVLIHPGNNVKDTKGCILVGERCSPDTLCKSKATFNRLWELMEDAWSQNRLVYIKIR